MRSAFFGLVTWVLLANAVPTRADSVTFDFDDLSGWSTTGNVSIVTGSGEITNGGDPFALMTLDADSPSASLTSSAITVTRPSWLTCDSFYAPVGADRNPYLLARNVDGGGASGASLGGSGGQWVRQRSGVRLEPGSYSLSVVSSLSGLAGIGRLAIDNITLSDADHPDVNPVPLPPAAVGGLLLLGLTGAAQKWRRGRSAL